MNSENLGFLAELARQPVLHSVSNWLDCEVDGVKLVGRPTITRLRSLYLNMQQAVIFIARQHTAADARYCLSVRLSVTRWYCMKTA